MKNNDFLKSKMRSPRSTTEMERRWKLASNAMKNKGIDLLLVQNDNQYIGGYVRWFIDVPAVQGYPMSVLFHQDIDLTTITHGAPKMPLLPEWAMRRETKRLSAPYIRSLNYTDRYDARLITEIINDRKIKRLGLVGNAQINHVIVDEIRENCQVEIVDATRIVDHLKSYKSAEEVACVHASAAMHDSAMEYAAEIIAPGMFEYELQAALCKKLIELGSEEQLLMIGSAPAGTCAPIMYAHYQNRQFSKGDEITLMIECSGPGGYYCEMGRSFALGCDPSDELDEKFSQSRYIQQQTSKMLKPDRKACEVTAEVNMLLKKMDLPEEQRIFTHGQGYDLIESPGFDLIDDSLIQKNMCIAIHPTYVNSRAFAFCCDNYLVSDQGCERLEKFPQIIVRI